MIYRIIFLGLLLSTGAVIAEHTCPHEPAPDPVPVAGNLPIWLSSTAENTWAAIGENFSLANPVLEYPGWVFGGGATYHEAVIKNWNGGIAFQDSLVIPFSGGHKGSSQNTVYTFGPFSGDTPAWSSSTPSHAGGPGETITDWLTEEGVGYYSDGRPSSRHTYSHVVAIPDLGGGARAFAPFGYSVYGSNGGAKTSKAASYNFISGYEPENSYSDFPETIGPGGGVAWDSATNKVWIVKTVGPDALWSYDISTDTYVNHNSSSPAPDNDTEGFMIDPVRRVALIHSSGDRLVVWDISAGREGEFVEIFQNYTGSLRTSGDIGFEFEPIGNKIVGYNGGSELHILTPSVDYRNVDGSLNSNASWTWVPVVNGAGGVTPTQAASNGTYGRFRYIESIRSFAVLNGVEEPFFVYRVPEAGL